MYFFNGHNQKGSQKLRKLKRTTSINQHPEMCPDINEQDINESEVVFLNKLNYQGFPYDQFLIGPN